MNRPRQPDPVPGRVAVRRRVRLIATARQLLALALVGAGGLPGQTLDGNVRTRAEAGDAQAANLLANQYAQGEGVPQDWAEAIRWYQFAADRGLAVANFNLGLLHETGRGVPADPEKAFGFYMKAAQKGVAAAQFNVGNMYANGSGVAPDDFEALLWFRQAAELGLGEAQYSLALAYERGRGVRQDESLARRWYLQAVAQGNARAQYNLGVMMEEGRGGEVSLPDAEALYRAAALQGFAPAQTNLGLLLAAGRGVTQDMVEAYAWLALGAEGGMGPEARDLVARQLTDEQLGRAQQALERIRVAMKGGPGREIASPAGLPASGEPVRTPAPDDPSRRAARPDDPLPDAAPAGAAREIPLEQLAVSDPRVARLIYDNKRLSQESLRANLRLVQVSSQLRAMQDRERLRDTPPAPAPIVVAPAENAELATRLEVMRRTIAKLVQENRWLHQAQAEMKRNQADRAVAPAAGRDPR